MQHIEDVLPAPKDELLNDFGASLQKRIQAITDHWHVLAEGNVNAQSVNDFVESAHNLAGSASIHGFIAISKLSYRLIDLGEQLLVKGPTLPFNINERIEKLINNLSAFPENHASLLPENNASPSPKNKFVPLTLEMPQTQSSVNTESKEVYVVESDQDEIRALDVFLDNAGFSIRTFPTLNRLHKAIEASPPLALILDLDQYENDTTGASFRAVLQDRGVDFPIIVISQESDMKQRLSAAQLGASHFFLKPVDGYRLSGALHKFANQHTARTSRVLLVDDDVETSRFLALHLKNEHIHVSVLNDPLVVLDSMAKFQPDLVVTDLYMPDCNGLELATVLRQHEAYFDTPIVFLTSEESEEIRLAALQTGSDDYFNKSSDLAVLVEAIKSKLKRLQSYAQMKKAMIWSPN